VTLRGTRVLVTGAGGFIGSHLAERLAQEGARVRALVRYNALGRWGWLDESPARGDLEVVAGDVRDPGQMRAVVEGSEVVFHLAALIAIPYSYEAPASYVATNVSGTLNLLEAARAAGVRRFVHTSTSEVYGTAQTVPIDERHPLRAQSPYAATKIGADQLVDAFHRSFAFPVTIVRPFNTYGPRQSARAVLPTIIAQCLAGGPVRLGNLEPRRDLTFVTDTVDGFVRASTCEAAVGLTVQLGTGREARVGDLAERVRALTGCAAPVEVDAQRVRPGGSEVERLVADASLAQRTFGWTPRVDLDEGLQRTIEWLRPRLDRYRPGAYVV
jgi:NAD dependent epimerase/dehydratase